MIGVTIESLEIGDGAEIARVATERDVAAFVGSVGDYNPIHSDPEYAAATRFQARIAPGIWTAGLISAVIGTRLPGPGTIYLSQDLKFLRPVMLGDAIRARVEVLDADRAKNRVRLRTLCVNQRGEEVLTGEALVMPSRTRVVYDKAPARAAPAPWWGAEPLAWSMGWPWAWPWGWAAQSAALMHLLGMSALGTAAPRDRA